MRLTPAIALILSMIFNFSRAQSPVIQWQHCYGGSNIEDGWSVIPTFDHGYLLSGISLSNNGNVTGNHGGVDFWAVKVDSIGTMQWQKCFGGSNDEYATSAIQTSSGEFIITGSTQSINGDISSNHGLNDGWLVKLDSLGNIIHERCFGGSGQDGLNWITSSYSCGFLLLGNTGSIDGDVQGIHSPASTGDIWIVKVDTSLNIQWQKCIGGSENEFCRYIQQTRDSGYIMLGYTYSTDGDITITSKGFEDYWICKLDSSGNIIWQKNYGGSQQDLARSVKQTRDGGFMVLGWTSSNDSDVTGYHGAGDIWVLKLDSSGALQWQKCFGGSRFEDVWSMDTTTSGGFIIAGETVSDDGDVSFHYGMLGISDWWILQMDSLGNLEWERSLGGTSNEMAQSIRTTEDGGCLAFGWSNSFDFDLATSGNHGGDYWAVKLNYFTLDAAIYEILYPGSAWLCDNVFIPELIIRNNAPAALSTANINYQVDGGGVQSYLWTGNLLRDSAEQVSLPSLNLPAGNHTLKIFVSNPNGGVDENPLNDTLTRAFTIDQNFATLPFEEGFQDTLFPPNRWQFYDPYNLFYHLTTTGGFGNSDSCLRVRMYTATGFEFAQMILPETDFTNLIAPANMTFSLASAMKNSSSQQTLNIYITSDCENSWTQIYQKEDTALSTTGFHSGNFTPMPNEWRTESLDLTPYIGEPHIQLGIEFTGQFTNNIHIDDINILDAVSGLSEMQAEREKFSCYFVSSINSLEVICYAKEDENAQVHLMDITGKIVLQQPMQLIKGFNSRKYSTVELTTGIYFGRIITATGVVAKKVVVE